MKFYQEPFWPQLVCKTGDKKTFLAKFVEWFWPWARLQLWYMGTNRTKPFHYQKFQLNEIIVYQNGLPIAGTPVSTTDNKRIYYNTLEILDFVFGNSHGISLANYRNHYINAFDLTSTQEASHDFIPLELTNCTISVKLKFEAPLGENVELLFNGERASTVYVRSDRKIANNTLMIWIGGKWTICRLLSWLTDASIWNIDFSAFSANLALNTILKRDNAFIIVNASNSDQSGTHWLLFAQAAGEIFFAHPLGWSLHNYPHVYKNMRRSNHEGNQIMMNKQIQSAN